MNLAKKLIADFKEGKQQYKRFGFFVLLSRVFLRLLKPLVRFYTERIYEKDLAEDIVDVSKPSADIEVKLLTPDLHDELNTLRPLPHRKSDYIQNRLNENQTCFLAISNNKIVFHEWAVRGERVFVDQTTTWPLKVESNEVYVHDCFTVPEYRGKGIFPYMLNELIKFYMNQNAASVKAIVYGNNYASWKAFDKAGFKLCTVVRYMKFFFLKKPVYFKKK